MTRWKIRPTRFGFTLLLDGEMVASADDPFTLMFLTIDAAELEVS